MNVCFTDSADLTAYIHVMLLRVSRFCSVAIRTTSAMDSNRALVAVCQMTAAHDMEENFTTCSRLIAEAKERKAKVVQHLPDVAIIVLRRRPLFRWCFFPSALTTLPEAKRNLLAWRILKTGR